MNKLANIEQISSQIIAEHFCFDGATEFEKDCAYAAGVLSEAYQGTLSFMPGMEDLWPEAKVQPLLLSMSSWCEISTSWGTERKVIDDDCLSSHHDNWTFYATLSGDRACDSLIESLVREQISYEHLADYVLAESEFLDSMLSHRAFNDLFSGLAFQVIHSIASNKLDAPLLHWLFFLDVCTIDIRRLVDTLKPSAEYYICMDSMERLLRGS